MIVEREKKKEEEKSPRQDQPEAGACPRSQSCCAIPAAIVPSAQPTSPTAVDSPQRRWWLSHRSTKVRCKHWPPMRSATRTHRGTRDEIWNEGNGDLLAWLWFACLVVICLPGCDLLARLWFACPLVICLPACDLLAWLWFACLLPGFTSLALLLLVLCSLRISFFPAR